MKIVEKIIKASGDTSPDEFEVYDIQDAIDKDGNVVEIRGNSRIVTVVKVQQRIDSIENKIVNINERLTNMNDLLVTINNL